MLMIYLIYLSNLFKSMYQQYNIVIIIKFKFKFNFNF